LIYCARKEVIFKVSELQRSETFGREALSQHMA
jgi:hypothetical protein